MDELNLMRSFRAERAQPDPAARAQAWRALEARFEAAPAAAAPIAPTRRGRFSLRRRLLVFAGAAAAAAAAAGVLVLGSGPTAQPAAAQILRETAAIAASPEGPAASPLPGPGQFLYTKVARLQFEGWITGCRFGIDRPCGSVGAMMSGKDAFNALMPTIEEQWLAADGSGRRRELAGTPRFLTAGERRHWEAEGSPLPAPFEPEYQRNFPLAFEGALELGRGVVDVERTDGMRGFRFPDTSRLPTDPQELRRTIEGNRASHDGFNGIDPGAARLDSAATTAELLNILSEGSPMTPQLRAAVFNALAEMPGIEVDTDASDFLGRPGYAIRSIEPKTGNGSEFVFDPGTAELLAKRYFIGDPAQNPRLEGVPAGATVNATAYLETGIVDSTREAASD